MFVTVFCFAVIMIHVSLGSVAAWDSTAMNNSSEPNPATTDSLIKKLSYNSKKSTFTWRGSFDELKIFCFELLDIDSTTCSITQNEQRKSIKAKSLTVNYYKTGTLQLQGNNVQSAKDKLRAAMDGGKTNCDLNDESEDVVSDRHVVVDDDKSQVDTPELSETSSNETDHFIKPISPHSLDVNILSLINDLRTEVTKLWSCVQSTQYANNSKTLQELDAVKNENHTLQQELQAARVHYTELQKELKAIREERDSLKLALQIVSKDLYHNSFAMQPDNSRVDTEYQDTQDFVLVGKKKKTGDQQNQPSTETNQDGRHSQSKTSSSCQLNTERTKGNSGAGRSTQRKQREVFLVSDSILKNLQGRKMSNSAKVKISSFPGCSTQDMRDHIRPILRKNPDEIVLHVGTNSRRSSTSARECAEEIVNLAHMISDESSAK